MITIGYSTRYSKPEFKEYLTKTCSLKNIQIIEKINNGEKSLSQVYNEVIDESEHNIIVLCHDDIEFDTNKWGDKLLKNFRKNPEYGILGMAGSKYLDSSAQWWKVPQTMYGIVNHKNNGKKWESKYSNSLGDSIEEVVLVDGLFISFDKTKIKHKFDESIKGFHFYDLGFSIPNYLDDVNIGVMFNIRLTHLSIGQTNQQWENNRYLFSQRYRNDLPIDITDTEYDNETFICVHDQNIILDYEKSSKFNILKNYRYIFLGDRPNDLIKNNPKVIIARNYENNLEDYPYFTAFTGWYLLWKNNLITTKYITLLEYDTLINENFEQIISKMIYENKPMIGYVPVSVNNYHYIDNNNWVEHIFKAISSVYKMNIQSKLKTLISKNPNLSWSSTSNITFRNDIFNDFMKWFEPLIPHLKDTKTSGHAFERAVSFYYFTKNKEMVLTNGVIKHIQMDSHKTQGHTVDYDDNMNKLINNDINNTLSNSYEKIKVLSFAKGNFIPSQEILKQSLSNIGVNNQIHLTDNDLPEEFLTKYDHILKYKKCFGCCIWKPYIIYNELQKLNDDEILFYVDSTDYPKKPLFDYILNHFKNNDILLFNRGYNNGQWTKRDTFVLMDCDSERFYNSVQLEAGVIALKKSDYNLKLIDEWFNHCTDNRKITDEPNTCGLNNLNTFVAHRHDQSILTNICIKQEINSHNFDTKYIEYNYNQPPIY